MNSDFVPALGQFLGSSVGLWASVITRLTEAWKAEQRSLAQRDLSGVDYAYLWADGTGAVLSSLNNTIADALHQPRPPETTNGCSHHQPGITP